jgi:HEAT repeat protein
MQLEQSRCLTMPHCASLKRLGRNLNFLFMNELSPALKAAKTDPDNETALRAAFVVLNTYGEGSDRGGLLPIDQAVAASPSERSSQAGLESELLNALRTRRSSVTGEYVCSKLALIGSEASVPALAALLADPQLSTSARNALEAIPGTAASKALRNNLVKVSDAQKVGVINSLGVRRDPKCVSLLAPLMRDERLDLAIAAIAAIGEIATIKAAGALQKFLPQAAQTLRDPLADAALVCAERLSAEGHKDEAQLLYRMLIDSPCAVRFKDAGRQGLHNCAEAH